MDTASQILEDLKQKGKNLINQWVAEGYREDLHLDFKRKRHPGHPRPSDDDRRNYSKALSGFANSDSGILVWGIGSPGKGPAGLSKHPIHKVDVFAEFLDSFVDSGAPPDPRGVDETVV